MTEKDIFSGKLEKFVSDLKEHISSDDGQWTVKGFKEIHINRIFVTASRSAHTASILRTEAALRIFNFPTVLMPDISALA